MGTEILLVEDNPGDARLVREMLSAEAAGQFEIEDAGTLADAEKMLGGKTYEVVLLDLSLPDGSGIELVRRIADVAKEAAIILLTGRADENLAIEALRSGAQDYFNKMGLTGFGLARSMTYAIERQRIRQQAGSTTDELYLLSDVTRMITIQVKQYVADLDTLTQEALEEIPQDDASRNAMVRIQEHVVRIRNLLQTVGL